MGASISKKHEKKYSKLDLECSDDEETSFMIPMQTVSMEPHILNTPQYVISKLPPSLRIKNKIVSLREEIVDTLDRENGPKLLLLNIKFESSPVFDDLVQFVCDQKFILQCYIPVICIDSNDALNTGNTNENILKLRTSCLRALDKGVNIGIVLNTVIGVTYFSDLCSVGVLKCGEWAPLASITTLPVICNTYDILKQCVRENQFYGVCGLPNPCAFNSTGNKKTYVVDYTEYINFHSHQNIWCKQNISDTPSLERVLA